jgi:hypothetical protein
VARVINEILPEKENVKLGCPSKLSSLNRRRIVSSITTGKADNAVQATHLINPALTSPISAQTVCKFEPLYIIDNPCIVMNERHSLSNSMETNLMFHILEFLEHVLMSGYHLINDKTSSLLNQRR